MFGTLFGFNGRLSRGGYIESLSAIVLADIAAVLLANVIAEYGLPGGYFEEHPMAPQVSQAMPLLAAILTVWALAATTVKRCHDRNRSGWLALITLIPAIGWLWLVIDLILLKGARGQNRYGAEPHGGPPGQPIGWQGEFLTADTPATEPARAEEHARAYPEPLEEPPEAHFPETRASGHEAGDPDAPSGPDAANSLHGPALEHGHDDPHRADGVS